MKTHRYLLMYLSLTLGLTVNGCAASDPSQATLAPVASIPVGPVVAYWPIALDSTEGRIEVYQPQPEAMAGNTLTARAAISLMRPGASAPIFGVAWFTAHVITDRDTRTTTLRELTINDVRFPGSTAAEQQDFARAVGGQLSTIEMTFPLDQLMSSLDTAHRE